MKNPDDKITLTYIYRLREVWKVKYKLLNKSFPSLIGKFMFNGGFDRYEIGLGKTWTYLYHRSDFTNSELNEIAREFKKLDKRITQKIFRSLYDDFLNLKYKRAKNEVFTKADSKQRLFPLYSLYKRLNKIFYDNKIDEIYRGQQ